MSNAEERKQFLQAVGLLLKRIGDDFIAASKMENEAAQDMMVTASMMKLQQAVKKFEEFCEGAEE